LNNVRYRETRIMQRLHKIGNALRVKL
jgi:hypothetical protein